MKKSSIRIISIVSIILSITTVSILFLNNPAKNQNAIDTINTQKNKIDDKAIDDSDLKDGEIIWWTIKTNTGIPTFIAELKNTNDTITDFNFNVEYFKDNKKIKTSQDLYAVALPAGKNTIIIDTWEIPKSADNIKITYTYKGKSTYTGIDPKIIKEERTESGVNLEFSVAGNNFEEINTHIVYYLGDKLVAFDQKSIYKDEELKFNSETIERFDSYKIYTYAIKN